MTEAAALDDQLDSFTPEELEKGRLLFAGECQFIAASNSLNNLPPLGLPEVAFAGRSNVGKSSLVNALTGRRTLARASQTPGRTRQLIFFSLADRLQLVDLPGYGYAQVSKKKRATFQRFIEQYFLEREQLVCTFVLVDSRHDPQKIDLEFMQFLGERQIPFCIVFTKVDKLGSSKLNKQIVSYKKKLLETWEDVPTSFITSSTHGSGRDEFLEFIHNVNQDVAANFR